MKVYIYYEDVNEPNASFFSFNKEQLINQLKEEYEFMEDSELEKIFSQIQESDIIFPECSWVITNYDLWNAEYTLEKFVKTTNDLLNIDFSKYTLPELHQIDEEGNIDNEPFIFIQ